MVRTDYNELNQVCNFSKHFPRQPRRCEQPKEQGSAF